MLLDFRRVFFCLLGFWLLFNIQLDTHQDMHFHSQLLASCHFKRHSSRHAFSFTLFIMYVQGSQFLACCLARLHAHPRHNQSLSIASSLSRVRGVYELSTESTRWRATISSSVSCFVLSVSSRLLCVPISPRFSVLQAINWMEKLDYFCS
jgi:hypothetical protein